MEIALIHNNSLIIGPMNFNYRMINSDLEELEVEERIGPRSYENIPIHFNDGITHLLPIEKDIPPYDARYHNLGNFSWEIISENDIPTKVKFTYPIFEKSLEEVKYIRKQEVAPIRWTKENIETIKLNINGVEVEVSTDREERAQFVTKLVSCSNIEHAVHNYKFRNDVWVEIGCPEIQYILEQIDSKVQEAFNWEYLKLQEIDACQTAEDVYNVVLVEVPAPPELPVELQ